MALTSTDTRPPLPIQLFAPGPTCAAWLALGLLVLAPHLAQPELRRVAGLLPLLYAGALVHAALALRLFAGGAHDRSIPSRLAPAALAALSVGGGMALIARATGEAELVGPAALLSAALTISWSLLIAADAERARGLAGLWITTNGLAAAGGLVLASQRGGAAGVLTAHALAHSILAALLLFHAWREERALRYHPTAARQTPESLLPAALILACTLLWSIRHAALPVPSVLPARYALVPCLALVFLVVAPVAASLAGIGRRRERLAGLGALVGAVLASPAIALAWSLAGGLSTHGLAGWAFFFGLPAIAAAFALSLAGLGRGLITRRG